MLYEGSELLNVSLYEIFEHLYSDEFVSLNGPKSLEDAPMVSEDGEAVITGAYSGMNFFFSSISFLVGVSKTPFGRYDKNLPSGLNASSSCASGESFNLEDILGVLPGINKVLILLKN